MHSVSEYKTRAIVLRKQGLSYSEILERVPVAKSTLSLWLHSVQLAKKQTQRLSKRKHAAQKRGAAVRHAQRVDRARTLIQEASSEIGTITLRERLLIGAALYWAEGSKEKSYRPGTSIDFANTDPHMVRFFVQWLRDCCAVPEADIYGHLYIHEYQRPNAQKARLYWVKVSGLTEDQITGVYFKRHDPKTTRYGAGDEYYGTLRVRVRVSSNLVRKIQGWTAGICA